MLIEIHDVSKSYISDSMMVTALQPTSLTIRRGELLAILGPSGSGKSTLMNIMGLLDYPSSGECLLDGVNCAELSPDQVARVRNQSIGFVFQSYHLLARQTILDNVELPLLYAGVGRRERRQRAMRALDEVRLSHRITHFPTQLSGGEQQRAAIARAIVTNPAIILADEPTGALDSVTGQAILQLLIELNDAGCTVVLVTHDGNIARHAPRIITICDGRIVANAESPDPIRPARQLRCVDENA